MIRHTRCAKWKAIKLLAQEKRPLGALNLPTTDDGNLFVEAVGEIKETLSGIVLTSMDEVLSFVRSDTSEEE
jgi:hypothetical protein